MKSFLIVLPAFLLVFACSNSEFSAGTRTALESNDGSFNDGDGTIQGSGPSSSVWVPDGNGGGTFVNTSNPSTNDPFSTSPGGTVGTVFNPVPGGNLPGGTGSSVNPGAATPGSTSVDPSGSTGSTVGTQTGTTTTNPTGSTGSTVGTQTGTTTTNPGGTDPTGSTGTNIGNQTGTTTTPTTTTPTTTTPTTTTPTTTPGNNSLGSDEGTPCTEGDIINLQQVPAVISTCNAAGSVWDYVSNSCKPRIQSNKSSCSWSQVASTINSTSFQNASASQYIQTFNNFRNNGAKLVDCGQPSSSSDILIVQVVQNAPVDKANCSYSTNPVYTYCYVGDASSVPASLQAGGPALVDWCLAQ